LTSTALDGLRLRAEGTLLRVYDPIGALLPTAWELDGIARDRAARQREDERVMREQAARLAETEQVTQAQAARLAQLEEELALLRAREQQG